MSGLGRLVIVAALAAALAGCTGQGSDVRGDGSLRGTPMVIGFVPKTPNLVQVVVEDRAPVQQVELRGPAGQAYWAESVDSKQIVYDQDLYGYTRGYRPGYYNPPYDLGVGAFGSTTGHLGGGVGTGVPFYSANETVPRPVAMKSIARIAVEDMAGYKATWQQWRTRVHFEGGRVIELEAPQPPMPLPPKS
jgi:hypothetical protein